MGQIKVGIIGTGWCGGIRARACADSPMVSELHIAEIDAARRAEVQAETNCASATDDYQKMLTDTGVDTIIISATPEGVHYPMARDSTCSSKNRSP